MRTMLSLRLSSERRRAAKAKRDEQPQESIEDIDAMNSDFKKIEMIRHEIESTALSLNLAKRNLRQDNLTYTDVEVLNKEIVHYTRSYNALVRLRDEAVLEFARRWGSDIESQIRQTIGNPIKIQTAGFWK